MKTCVVSFICNLVPRAFSLAWGGGGKGPGNEVVLYDSFDLREVELNVYSLRYLSGLQFRVRSYPPFRDILLCCTSHQAYTFHFQLVQ